MIFRCASDARRQALAGKSLTGIDYLELGEVTATRAVLLLRLVNPLAGPVPEPELWRIDGGDPLTTLVVAQATGDPDPRRLRLVVTGTADLGRYRLRLVADEHPFPTPPAGWDPALSEVTFTVRPGCDDADCAPPAAPGTPEPPPPPLDYTARDYPTLRAVALDRLAMLQPGWRQAETADIRTALVEALAYQGDRLSYLADAVDAEGLLDRARRRVSVRRLTRLVDYRMDDGCAARIVAQLAVRSTCPAPLRGARLLTAARDQVPVIVAHSLAEDRLRRDEPQVFEIVEAPEHLYASHNLIRFHTWSGAGCLLPAGAVRATLAAGVATLAVGDLLLLGATRPADPSAPVDTVGTEELDDSAPALRHLVRIAAVRVGTDPVTGAAITEVAWGEDDALPFDLPVTAVPVGVADPDDPDNAMQVAAAFGNLVLADHGETVRDPFDQPLRMPLPPVPDPAGGDDTGDAVLGGWRPGRPSDYRPYLPVSPIAMRRPHVPYDRTPGAGGGPRPVTRAWSARAALAGDPSDTLAGDPTHTPLHDPGSAPRGMPAVDVHGDSQWIVAPDLLAMNEATPGVVVEVEDDGRARLRFGNGVDGRMPRPGEPMTVIAAVGGGTAGNVPAHAVSCYLHDGAGSDATLRTAVARVDNPLPGTGGTDPEPTDRARRRAPATRYRQARCVTAQDYAARAGTYPGVQRAFARVEWTGSWETVRIWVDRFGGTAVDPDFEAELLAYLEPYRLMGHDLRIEDPVRVALALTLGVCLRPGASWPHVRAALAERFSSRVDAHGVPGLFHPDRLSFGAPVHTGPLLAAAHAVPGVAWARIDELRALGTGAPIAVRDGQLAVPPPAVPILDNDPGHPERGRFLARQVTS